MCSSSPIGNGKSAHRKCLSVLGIDSGRITGNPEVMPRMDSQRCWPEVGFVEVKSMFTFYPREHRSPVQSYGL
jgi:hypothetical protein